MADDGFRSSRRDPPGGGLSDPLAELARLIGQSEHYGARARDGGHAAEEYDHSAAPGGFDWSASDEGYAEPGHDDERYDYGSPRAPEPYQSDPGPQTDDARTWSRHRTREQEPPASAQYASSLPMFADAAGGRRYREEPPAFIPPARDAYQPDAHAEPPAPIPFAKHDYAGEEYDDDAPPARRKGAVLVVALVGLAVLGTAGALGYRAMFGGSVIPSLPPIIKPADTPIKIVPSHQAQNSSGDQTGATTANAQDHLVSHEEQPVTVQPANPGSNVVTTIPVISNTADGTLPGAQPSSTAAPDSASNGLGQPDGTAPPPDQLVPPGPPPDAREVHTLTIRPDQPAAAAPPPVPAAPAAQPSATTGTTSMNDGRGTPEHRQAQRRDTQPRMASGGPLSLIPTQEPAAPSRTRFASTRRTEPLPLTSGTEEPAPAAGAGGFAVQVTSRRSQAEAQAAFRSLQARFPQQLGGRRMFIRRVDLGAKGVYYRALVGPFASGEQAVSLCSSLKSAGGSCFIQRD